MSRNEPLQEACSTGAALSPHNSDRPLGGRDVQGKRQASHTAVLRPKVLPSLLPHRAALRLAPNLDDTHLILADEEEVNIRDWLIYMASDASRLLMRILGFTVYLGDGHLPCGSSPTLRRPTLTTRNRAQSLSAASALTAPRLSRDSHRQRLARLRVHGMGLPAGEIDRLVDIGRRHLRRLAEATSTKATVTATDFAIIPSIHATGCRSPNQ